MLPLGLHQEPHKLYGLDIHISDSPLCVKPKLQLSAECGCSTEFRESFNAWLVELFGNHYDIYRIGKSLIMPRECYERLLKGEVTLE